MLSLMTANWFPVDPEPVIFANPITQGCNLTIHANAAIFDPLFQ
tara:strand:- start:341 stop:472 length:132 start_codon:yes stop_codon:yes gene_type:complete